MIYTSIKKSFLGIYNESKLFDSLDDILYSITTYFCDEKSCHESTDDGVNVTALHITPYYPSVKFTFGLTNVVKNKNLHTIGINLKPNISCQLYIEDKRRYPAMSGLSCNAWFRFTRRPAWLALGRHVEIKEDLQPTGQEFIVELRYHIIQ